MLALTVAVLGAACSEAATIPTVTLAPPTTEPPPEATTTTSTTVPSVRPEAVLVGTDDNLGAMVGAAPAGTAFLLSPGTHRMHSIVPKDGMTFTGETGAVMNGAILLEDFLADESGWRHEGLEMSVMSRGNCISGYQGCTLSQDLFIDDVMLWQVTDLADLAPGRWLWSGDTIYLADDPAGRRVELSMLENAFVGAADDVTIADLKIEKYATPAQWGTVQAQAEGDNGERGRNWVIRNVEVVGSHGVGIRTGDGTIVSGVHVHHNGQMGIAVSGGTDVVIEDSEIAHNNIAGFEWGWEGGGLKATRTEGLVVRNNHSHNNNGPGLWTDIDAQSTLYEGNLVTDNAAAGIFHEISGAATIRNNTVLGNGFGKPEWLWGAGILVAASADVEVHGNLVRNNADGIAGIQQERGDGPAGPYLLQNVRVHENTIEMAEGQTGVVDDTGSGSVFTDRGIVFSGNTYVGVEGRRFAWNGRSLDRNGWLATGQDADAQWVAGS